MFTRSGSASAKLLRANTKQQPNKLWGKLCRHLGTQVFSAIEIIEHCGYSMMHVNFDHSLSRVARCDWL